MKLPHNLIRFAAEGEWPTVIVFCPIAEKSGAHIVKAFSEPAAIIKSSLFCAASGRPKTGAETKLPPA